VKARLEKTKKFDKKKKNPSIKERRPRKREGGGFGNSLHHRPQHAAPEKHRGGTREKKKNGKPEKFLGQILPGNWGWWNRGGARAKRTVKRGVKHVKNGEKTQSIKTRKGPQQYGRGFQRPLSCWGKKEGVNEVCKPVQKEGHGSTRERNRCLYDQTVVLVEHEKFR